MSAPYSAMTSSGFTTLRRLLDILATICETFAPVAFSKNWPSPRSSTSSTGTRLRSVRWYA